MYIHTLAAQTVCLLYPHKLYSSVTVASADGMYLLETTQNLGEEWSKNNEFRALNM